MRRRGKGGEGEKEEEEEEEKEGEGSLLRALLRSLLGIGNATPSTFYWSVQSQGQPRFREWGNRFFLLMGWATKSHCRVLGYREKQRIVALFWNQSTIRPYKENKSSSQTKSHSKAYAFNHSAV